MSSPNRFPGASRQAPPLLAVATLLMFTALAGAADLAAPATQPENAVPVDPVAARRAEQLLKTTGRDAGLCVVMGGDGRLAAALHLASGRRLLVVQWAFSPEALRLCRDSIQSVGLYGPVSAELASLKRLPLADSLANMVIVDDIGLPKSADYSIDEVSRILQPGSGLALVATTPPAAGSQTTPCINDESGCWLPVSRPRTPAMDEWTHPLHGPDGNLVSHDTLVGPPTRLQWLAGPVQPLAVLDIGPARAILSAGGRNYYLLPPKQVELPTFSGPTVADDPADLPGGVSRGVGNYLLARDAFNGLPLWRRRLDGPSPDGRWPSALVADADRIYGIHNGLAVAIDGRTGRIVANYGRAGGWKWLLKGSLLMMVESKEIRAVDVRTPNRGWVLPIDIGGQVQIVADDRLIVFSPKANEVRGVDLASGKEEWKVDSSAWSSVAPTRTGLLFAREGLVVFDADMPKESNTKQVTAISSKDGKLLWTYKYTWPAQAGPQAQMRWSVFYAGGLIWVQKWFVEGEKGQRYEALDPKTGAAVRSISAPRPMIFGCHQDVASDRFIVFNRPADFLNLEDGSLSRFRASRPACGIGAVLANGLYYSSPGICGCVAGTMPGFFGMASQGGAAATRPDETPRLETGPAFGKALGSPAGGVNTGPGDWPTFRHDPARSASADGANLPDRLKVLWRVNAAEPGAKSLLADEACGDPVGGDRVTAPAVAAGRVFVSCPEAHRVVALDAASGKVAWSATLGGRLDTPPTICDSQDGPLALVGCRDGSASCLRAGDGELVWRFRVGPHDRRIIAFGQLESPWPVVGGVLVKDGVACVSAGRTSEMDGGVIVCGLVPETGRLLWEVRPPADDTAKGFVGLADMLVADGQSVAMGGGGTSSGTHLRVDPKTGQQLDRKTWIDGLNANQANNAVLMERSWRVGVGGRNGLQLHGGLSGQIVAFDSQRVVAAQRRPDAREVLATTIRHKSKVEGGPDKAPPPWSVKLPEVQVEALALAGERLLVGTVSADRVKCRLLVLSLKDGSQVGEYELPAAVSAEGIAVAGERVYVSTSSGEVLCLGGE